MKLSHLSALLALPALLALAGCATTGHPCFSEQAMFPDNSSSCQYGREYRCDDGDWIAFRRACAESPTDLSQTAALAGHCEYGGISFASGSASCRSGTQYRCDNGTWSSLDLPCPVADAPIAVSPSGVSCSYRGMTVPSSSAICQSGITFVCNDGQWSSLGTHCR